MVNCQDIVTYHSADIVIKDSAAIRYYYIG